MTNNQSSLLQYICDFLQKDQGCHTAILYGSKARGDDNELSDFDVIGFAKVEHSFPKPIFYQSKHYLDLWIYPEKDLLKAHSSYLHILDGKILFEKENLGTDFLKKLKALELEGPCKITEDQYLSKKLWSQKMYLRSLGNDPDSLFRRIWLMQALLEDYFLVRNLWFKGPKKSFQFLKINDKNFYNLYSKTLSNISTSTEGLNACFESVFLK